MATVLILGAGTSIDYGYPSGLVLVDMIKERLRTSSEQTDRDLLVDLKDRKPYSIDAFLHEFPKHDRVAKSAIAEILYECEEPEVELPASRDFYRFLFQNISEAEFSNFKIITFNYDRSLEYFWARSLRPSKGSLSEAYKSLSAVEIIHIHGRLSALPDEANGPLLKREREQLAYGSCRNLGSTQPPDLVIGRPKPSPEQHREFMLERKRTLWQHGQSSFKTVYENNEVHGRAKEILSLSNRLIFLGFGYHELNMKLLGLDWTVHKAGYYITGTSMGMSPVDLAINRQRFPTVRFRENCSAIEIFQKHISLTDPNVDLP